MKTAVIIPARYQSSRYPGKPLVRLLGKPMILWVAELSEKAVGRENVYVATDSEKIGDLVKSAGFKSVTTSSCAPTGTDRLAEACASIEADIFINVQGDEPLVSPTDILKIRDVKSQNMHKVINGYTWITECETPSSVNIPKVVTNESDELVYMSRALIPGLKDASQQKPRYKKQVCIYAFTKEELLAFKAYGRKSTLESFEDIEILRFIELGKQVLMVSTDQGSLAVDVPSDVQKVEAALSMLWKNES